MQNNDRVLVLSGKQSNALLSKNLKAMGAYVILVDKYENSYARPYADEWIPADQFDYGTVKDIVLEKKPSRIATIGIELTFKIASRIHDELGIAFPYSYDEVLSFTEKDRMKTVFQENGIPSARHQILSSPDELSPDLNFPLVVKPVDSCGSQGVSKVETRDQASSALSFALSKSVSGQTVVEEFVSGPEYQADCFVQDGKVHVIMVKRKLKFEEGLISSQVGSLTAPVASPADYAPYQAVANKISKAFGIKDGIFFFQAINHESNLSVIEIGVRIGGGWSYKMIQHITGFDYPLAATNAQMGVPTPLDCHLPEKYYMTNFLFPEQCTFDRVTGLEDLKSDGVIEDYEVLKQPGSDIDGFLSNRNRTAIYMISDDTFEGLLAKMTAAVRRVDIIGVDGKPCLDRNKYFAFIERMKVEK